MNLTAILIPADTGYPMSKVNLEDPDLGTYQQIVQGPIGFLDIVRPPGSLCFNENGKLLELPLNPRATALLYLHRPEFVGFEYLAGDVLVLGRPDRKGDSTPAPDVYVHFLLGSTPH